MGDPLGEVPHRAGEVHLFPGKRPAGEHGAQKPPHLPSAVADRGLAEPPGASEMRFEFAAFDLDGGILLVVPGIEPLEVGLPEAHGPVVPD